MVVGHIAVGVAFGTIGSVLLLMNGYPVWLAVLTYSVAGAAFTLLSALVVFAASECAAEARRAVARWRKGRHAVSHP